LDNEGSSLSERLWAPFPEGVVQLDEDNRPYVPEEAALERLTQVLGDGSWSFRTVRTWREDAHGRILSPGDESAAEWTVTHGILTITWPNGRVTHHEGRGSDRIQRFGQGKREGQVVDPGNDEKGAETQAIRNACQRVGIGTYLKDRNKPARSGGGGRKPAPPRVDPQQAAAAAQEAAQQRARSQEIRQRVDSEVAGSAQAKAVPPAQGAAEASAQSATAPESAGAKRDALPADAKWYVLPNVAEDQLSAPAEAVVIENRGWSQGTVHVDVAGVASGQKATLTFTGPAAGRLATAKKDQHIWVRLGPDKVVTAYHIPGDKKTAEKSKAG